MCYWKTRRKRKQSETRWVCMVTGSPQGQETMSPPTQKHSWGQQKIHQAGQHVVWLKIQEEGGRKSVKVEDIRKWEHTCTDEQSIMCSMKATDYTNLNFYTGPCWFMDQQQKGVSTIKIRKIFRKSSLKHYSNEKITLCIHVGFGKKIQFSRKVYI